MFDPESKKDTVSRLKESGVIIYGEDSVYIDDAAVIESGVIIYPNNHIYGKTTIKSGAVLEPNNIIYDSEIGCGVSMVASVVKNSRIGDNTTVGPNAYIRPNSVIGNSCRVGDFVEIKNSRIGDGTKISHLTYIGDAEVGKNCNFGCGVIFANYDGKKKYKTTVGDNCFIGSNCNLIAPVRVADGAFVAAGTTVTDDVKEKSFVIGRVRQAENEKLKIKYIGGEN